MGTNLPSRGQRSLGYFRRVDAPRLSCIGLFNTFIPHSHAQNTHEGRTSVPSSSNHPRELPLQVAHTMVPDAESISDLASVAHHQQQELDRELEEHTAETSGTSLPVPIPRTKPVALSPKSPPRTKRTAAFKGSPSSMDRLARKLGISRR